MGGITGRAVLDWALVALSSFNTILPLWLGITVLLNAERRAWGVWLAGGSLIAAGIFFIVHTALLDSNIFVYLPSMWLVWRMGWIAVQALPFAWYTAALWFAGFWDRPESGLRQRHRYGLMLAGIMGVACATLALTAEWSNEGAAGAGGGPTVSGLPSAFVALYPAYLLTCYILSIAALGRLEPSGRVMGDIARVRARPWLMLTSILQIMVSVAVGAMLFWTAKHEGEPGLFVNHLPVLNWFDFLTELLVAGSIYALGEAIVSYEIFTGKILPRQGFRRHWRNALIVSTGFSALLSLALAMALPPIYDLMVATVLIALFYALLNWRSYRERDRYLEHLRPFIGSQQLYEGLLAGAGSDGAAANSSLPFRALCADVLGARRAFLIPLGPMAPLAGAPLAYPGGSPPTFPLIADLAATFDSPRTLCAPLEPERYDGAIWAIPLWSERGLIGVLMLGEKLDGSLYTQEEIEIARASGERLIDIQAGVEMARRLVTLQRRRLAESQVIDAQTRRVLHDDVLPQLHSVMLTLGATGSGGEAIGMMGELHRKISDLLRELPTPATQPAGRLGLLGAIRGAVEGEFRNLFDRAVLTVGEGAEERAGRVSQLAADVGYYAAREAMRNAAKYGRGGRQERPLHLSVEVTAWEEGIAITIEDDGVGLGPNRASEGGSGQGLALHSTMMAVVGGSLAVESSPGAFTRVVLRLPAGR